jgi:hypothetical protein
MSWSIERHLPLLCAAVLMNTVGCAHLHLRNNATRQANTTADIYEQQVLDNLARFVNNPHATPSFSVFDQASNAINDSGGMTLGSGFLTGRFFAPISSTGSRASNNSFTLKPVVAPNRLLLMQCAYQRAIGYPIDQCSKCNVAMKDWHGASECVDCNPCGINCGWVRSSRKWRDVPKCCCNKYGEDCDLYVWVDPCQREEFSKLVLAIIDYASGNAKAAADSPKKTVKLYLNDQGNQTAAGTHSQEIEATIPSGLKPKDAVNLLLLEAKRDKLIEDAKRNQLLNNDSDPSSKANLELEATLNELEQQIEELKTRAGSDPVQMDFGLPTQFNGSYGPGILSLEQQLKALGNTQ